MQRYVPGQDEAFAESRECFRRLEDWMASEGGGGVASRSAGRTAGRAGPGAAAAAVPGPP